MSDVFRQAAIGVIVREKKFLMITRGNTELAPGKVCFLGGGVEHGEHVEQALVRELDEELNIEVSPVRELWRSLSPRGTELCWWLADLALDQVIVPNVEEVAAFAWMEVRQIESLNNLLESNARFFSALQNGDFVIDRR